MHPARVQFIDRCYISDAESHLATADCGLGSRLHGMARPQPEFYPVVEDEQCEGRPQLYRCIVQQAAIEVGAGGRAVDVQQKVMGKAIHDDSLIVRSNAAAQSLV
ncbi:hypothetical protein AU074_10740 [Pseudomonas sp. ATCC PTA-122608]|nr:hypothetical protein AU074_10740 [Pseudomonas sp. ATCC PTA-122608]